MTKGQMKSTNIYGGLWEIAVRCYFYFLIYIHVCTSKFSFTLNALDQTLMNREFSSKEIQYVSSNQKQKTDANVFNKTSTSK